MIKRGAFRLISTFLYLISLLPFSLLYLVSDLLFLILYYLIGYRREVVDQNLANAFPAYSPAKRKSVAKAYFRFLADIIVESIKMLSISKEEIKRRFTFNDFDEVTKHFDRGRSVLVATGHYGNWEWGTHIISATIDEKVLVVYKPLSDKSFGTLINQMRSRFGAIMVPMKSTLRKIIESKNERFLAVFVSDQTPSRDDAQQFIDFLNQPTAVFTGIEKVAKLTNNPVVFCHIDRVKRGYYKATFKTISDQPQLEPDLAITLKHCAALEEIILQKPELWLWSHRRWKFKPEDIK